MKSRRTVGQPKFKCILEIDFGDKSPRIHCRSYEELRHSYQATGIHIITVRCTKTGPPVTQKHKIEVMGPAFTPP